MRYRVRVLALVLTSVLASSAPAVASAPAGRSLPDVIDQTQSRVVKIFGAGGFRGMEHYQSGFVISPEGHILTVLSYVLDAETVSVTLNDGRRYEAKLVGGDPRLEVAVLKIEASGLPYFDLAKVVRVGGGTPVLALSNLFGVAMGNEAASVQHGDVSVVTRLEARRGTFETPYHGPVYVLDMTTNNPGAAGGALVTRRGELVGMLGKELRNSQNNTWLNYAIPIDELRGSIEAIRSGKFVAQPEQPAEKKAQRPIELASLGIVLVPDVLERTPAFIDQIRPGSVGAGAGLQPDDLVLMVGEHLIQSCKSLRKELEMIDRDDAVRITVLRGQELLEVTLRAMPEGK